MALITVTADTTPQREALDWAIESLCGSGWDDPDILIYDCFDAPEDAPNWISTVAALIDHLNELPFHQSITLPQSPAGEWIAAELVQRLEDYSRMCRDDSDTKGASAAKRMIVKLEKAFKLN